MEFQAQSGQGPPPSSTDKVVKRLFVDSASQPLKIFVEPSEVDQRPKVVRTLKNAGGRLCEDAAEADIVVVALETISAKQLIDCWAGEKVILDAEWVRESVKRGSAYLEDENWGGFAAADGSSASTQKSHLPTPRETPSESKGAQEEVMQNQQYPPPNAQSQQQQPSSSPFQIGSQFQVQQMPQQLPPGQPMPGPGMVQNYPSGQPMISYFPQQFMPSLYQAQPPNPVPIAMISGQQFQPNYQQQIPPYMQQAMYMQSPYPPPVPQQMTFPPHMISMPFNQAMDAGSPMHTGGQFHTSVSPEMHGQGHQNNNISGSYRDSPMDQDEPPTLKRKAHILDHPEAGHSKRSKSSHSRHDVSSDNEELKLFNKDTGEPSGFFVQVDTRYRGKVAIAIKKNGGELVASISDADYVILGNPTSKNWEDYLRQAAYHGKLPVKPQWVYDCVKHDTIVDMDEDTYAVVKVEKKRGQQSSSGRRRTVTHVWEDNEEAEESEQDRPALLKKGKKIAKKEKGAKVKKEKKAEKKARPKRSEDEDTRASANGEVKSKATKERSPLPKVHSDTSPPPPTHVVEHVPGKNRYTEEDMDYCDKYIPILFARNPGTTTTAIAEKLHSKMPHHSSGSWMSRISGPIMRPKIDKWRRRAEIQSRKGHATSQRSTNGTVRGPVVSPPTPATSNPTAAFDPVKVMAKFFAEGRADSLEDAAVWHVMAKEYPRLTAQDWEKVWNEDYEAVQQEVQQEVQQLTGLGASEGGVGSELTNNSHAPKAE